MLVALDNNLRQVVQPIDHGLISVILFGHDVRDKTQYSVPGLATIVSKKAQPRAGQHLDTENEWRRAPALADLFREFARVDVHSSSSAQPRNMIKPRAT